MELLESTTLSSLDLNHLQIVDHSIDPPERYTLTIAPFESILSIKQQISLHYKDPYPYLPERLFLAVQEKDGYKPIEFQYANQTNILPDPSTSLSPDRRFVDETGIQILVNTHYFNGHIDMLEDSTIHIWNLKKIASSITIRDLLQFHGILQVYFPRIQSPEQVEQYLSTNLSREIKETFSYLQSYQAKFQDTLNRIDRFVNMPNIFDTIESLRISYLTTFHASLPALPSLQKEGIDVFFYKLKASRHIPYIRYFPYGRAPIVKLATGPGGVPFLTNIQLLRSFSTDFPIVEEGSVIMTKTPIESLDARIVQKGFAWTILFFENGQIEARLNAYRINDPITNPLIVRAFELLPQILSSLGWTGDAVSAMKLIKFAGMYEMQLAVTEDAGPTNQELQARIQAYSPLLFQEKTPLGIRWRAKEFDNPLEHALLLYSANNITKAKEQGAMLIQEFGISPVEARNAIERLGIKHKDEIETYGAILPVEQDTLGPSVVIENNHPTLLFTFNHVLSSIDLQRFFTILQILVLTSNKVFLKKILTVVEKLEKEEEEEDENNDTFDVVLKPKDAPKAEHVEPTKYNYQIFLEKADYNLFKFTSKKIKAYTTSCQKAQHRQPYVLSPNKFKDVKEKYKDRVNIVEFPLSEYNTEVATFIKKTPDERRKYNKKSIKEREMMEIHGLRLGLPLGGNVSFLGEKAQAITKTLIEEQQSKELWVVARAGSSSSNYYICSKLWCTVDQIPILAEEYEGAYMRNGAKKTLIPCCPFCGQQNVVERKDETIYVGYLKGKTHPKNMVLPCCFKFPDKATIPDGSAPIPPPPTGLEVELPEIVGEEPKKSEVVLKDLGASFKRIQGSAIYILRSTSFPLDAGTYGVPTPHVDSILGQVLDVYSTTSKGQLKVVEDPHAFLRFGISADKQKSGQNFIQFISYLLFVCARIGYGAPGISSINMMCPTDILEWMCEINQVSMARAFEASNYGMLIHEFHDPAEPDPGTLGSSKTLTEFQTWMGRMKLEKADRAYVIRFYKAWNRFVEYVSDPNEPKEFRLWDGLFSTPGLFSKDGIVVARITSNNLECPALGVNHYTREHKPVFVPVYYSEFLHIIEPLVYIETKKEYIGGIHPTAISKLSSGSRQKLTKLYAQYMEPIIGCGRPIPPLNVWAFTYKHTPLPYISTFLEYLRSHKEYKIHSILRERTNRVVGVLFTEKGVPFFIPLMDDGMIDTMLSSSYDVESIPLPSSESLYNLLIHLAKTFPSLNPIKIQYRILSNIKQCVAFQCSSNAIIPFQMYQEGTKTSPITDMDESLGFLWEQESILLKQEDVKSIQLMHDIQINPIELFEEAYQHLRLSLSNWLFRTEEGRATAIQIERLRSARNRLPLYELRKRGDLLLESLVRSWVTTEGVHTAPVLLRQDCLLLKEGECKGSCAMADGMCKIHTPTYGAIKDPAKVLSARLVDELLRSSGPAYEILQKHHLRVQTLRPPTDLVREGDSSLLSFEGRGDDSVYKLLGLKDRLFTTYTKGYVYPEEVSAEDLGREIATESGLPAGWEEAGWSRAADLSDILLNLDKVRNAVLLNLLMEVEMTYSVFETNLHALRNKPSSASIDWTSPQELEYLSQILKANFILTRKKVRTGILDFKDLIKFPGSEYYILFDSDTIPMLYHPSDSLPVHSVGLEELPEDVRIAVEIRS